MGGGYGEGPIAREQKAGGMLECRFWRWGVTGMPKLMSVSVLSGTSGRGLVGGGYGEGPISRGLTARGMLERRFWP